MTAPDHLDPGSAGAAAASPVMAQYLEIKQAHPGCLLFFRMGDFFELFFEDAAAAAAALGIALTKRGRYDGADIPMCGVPVHTAENYLARLIRAGFKVAICDQVEEPAEARKRGARGPLRRAVVRVVTAGTLTEDGLLDARRHNFLASLADAAGQLGLAWLDLSTGAFVLAPTSETALGGDLARIAPGEILLPDRLLTRPALASLWDEWKPMLTALPNPRFDSDAARSQLETFYGVGALDGFGAFTRSEIAAAGAVVDYVGLTQRQLPQLSPPRRLAPGSVMQIDAASRRNLELTTAASGGRRGSLIAILDRTLTAAGARLLADRLAAPSTEPTAIAARLDAVDCLLGRSELRCAVRERLHQCPDLERALTRLGLGRGGPRDLAALGHGLAQTAVLRELLAEPDLLPLPDELAEVRQQLGDHTELVQRLDEALAKELPLFARDGGFIAIGYSPELDEWRRLRDDSRRMIAALQAQYAAETGVGALKIRHNHVIGYYIEVPASHSAKLGPNFIHRQTMAGAQRYTSGELAELETRLASAAERTLALELQLYDELVAAVVACRAEIAAAAAALAAFDVAAALAERAVEGAWVRPLVEEGVGFAVSGGRHPTVEAGLALAGSGGSFVANDCVLDSGERIWLVTGPNMAGKSTFLRQNALIAILAQMGSYVPARAARIGIVDRLFSRVGAADDLARGRSTFMVEMVETAAILNQAGSHSFVILDEIGRGTATFDGLSIAWATIEHLHEVNRCRTLFATHYHELTSLAAKLPALACHTMRVKEWKGEVVFLHEVAVGTADRSYGIHVAKLAGLPRAVTRRAEEVLEVLEKGEQGGALARLADDLPLFRAARGDPGPARSAVESLLGEIRPDELTPRDALDLLYRLKALLGE